MTLLTVIERNPKAVIKALHRNPERRHAELLEEGVICRASLNEECVSLRITHEIGRDPNSPSR